MAMSSAATISSGAERSIARVNDRSGERAAYRWRREMPLTHRIGWKSVHATSTSAPAPASSAVIRAALAQCSQVTINVL